MFTKATYSPTRFGWENWTSLGVLLFLVTIVCGCGSAQSSAPRKAPDGPRQRFSQVVERFRNYYRGATVWLTTPVENDGIEHASFRVVVDDVTFQFDPPKGSTKDLSAEVTVRTSAYYQMNTQFLDPEEVESEKEKAEKESGLLSEDASELEPEENKDSPEEDWGSDTNRTVKTYDFAYEAGRWILKTSDLEEGVRMAFEYALNAQ